MSREIRFRVWSKKYNTYFELSGLHYENGKIDGIFAISGILAGIPNVIFLEPEDVILEQYTGLKDKNGKKIYEGDIVQEEIDFNSKLTDGVFKYEVYWDNDGLFWGIEPIGLSSIHDELWETNQSVEVIGNIHENPELLEKGE